MNDSHVDLDDAERTNNDESSLGDEVREEIQELRVAANFLDRLVKYARDNLEWIELQESRHDDGGFLGIEVNMMGLTQPEYDLLKKMLA